MNKKTILEVLNLCASAGYALHRSTLKTQVESRLGGQHMGEMEFSEDLAALSSKGLIDSRKDPITEDTLYFITGPGQTALRQ